MSQGRERSRSPHRETTSHSHNHSHRYRHHNARSRSRSPHRHSGHDRKHHTRSSRTTTEQSTRPLPLDATPLQKNHLTTYRPLFALYLDIQKQLDIEELPQDEVKGRWKSFIKKWNAGDLAEGWYDSKTFEKATQGTLGLRDEDASSKPVTTRGSKQKQPRRQDEDLHWDQGRNEDEDEGEDDYGPSLPTGMTNQLIQNSQNIRAGPSIPSTSDIRLRNEQDQEDTSTARTNHAAQLRTARTLDRKAQKERLDELAPRAEPGTRERQLEKKREAAAANRAFAGTKEAGEELEMRDADVMGDADSLSELKRMKEMEQRKKTERELRRDDILRAKTAEREERLKGMREKEAKTVEMLKSIARARFGAGGVADQGSSG